MVHQSNSYFLQFKNVKKSYDQRNLVVRDFNLDVEEGEFVTLLGPSGSGKTTVLMMLAGFENITGGSIVLNNKPIEQTAPYLRNIGIVFQNYALFPHMSVAENLAYPLKVRKYRNTDISEKVKAYLELIELGEFGDRRPSQLSGGQRQRVALARALIFEPTLVLMDEPLGALDKNLREQMQFEITRLHQRLGFTVIYVTHDQVEALTMSDRIAVFNAGVVQQCAGPEQLYERPSNAFVASFIGENNLIPVSNIEVVNGRAEMGLAGNGRLYAQNGNCPTNSHTPVGILSIRPEKIKINSNTGAASRVEASFLTKHYAGDFIRYFFKLCDGTQVVAKAINDLSAPNFKEGDRCVLGWEPDDSYAFLPLDSEVGF